jgi:hypothetical protein
MTIVITVPADTKTPGSAGHTSDHNLIVDALTALATSAANTAGDTFTGGVTLAASAPGTPAAGASVQYSTAGVPQVKLDSGLAGSLSPSQTDATNFVVTSAAAGGVQFSKQWAIPANDPNAGTLYRLTLWGAGTQGSTQQLLTPIPLLDATAAVGGGRTAVISTLVAISQPFNIRLVYELLILTAGAGGTTLANCTVEVTQNVGTVPLSQTISFTTSGAPAIDTTASHTFSFNAGWGSATGAPTVTSKGSLFERLGA